MTLLRLVNRIQQKLYKKQRKRRLLQGGFTIIEFVVVIAIIATLMAIVAPGWLRFVDTQRLVSAQAVIYQGIQKAQSEAQQRQAEWQFSVRDVAGVVEWSTHPKGVLPSEHDWKSAAHPSIQLDSETTLQLSSIGRTVRFDHKGNVASRLGRVTLSSKRVDGVKRCVYVSTIIGGLRQAKENGRSRSGDFCY